LTIHISYSFPTLLSSDLLPIVARYCIRECNAARNYARTEGCFPTIGPKIMTHWCRLPGEETDPRSTSAIPFCLRHSPGPPEPRRSEEHTSELQSRFDIVC